MAQGTHRAPDLRAIVCAILGDPDADVDRVEALDGQLYLESLPRCGTTLRARVPLGNGAADASGASAPA